MIFTADFETNNSETECRVWSWGLCSVENPDIYLDGKDIASFIQTVKEYCISSADEKKKIRSRFGFII